MPRFIKSGLRFGRTISVLILTIAGVLAVFAQTIEKALQLLEPGKTIERELAAGQKHGYRMPLGEGQYVRVSIEHRGIDPGLRLFAPDGMLLAVSDSEIGRFGGRVFEYVSEAAGDYELELSPLSPLAPTGRYVIRIAESRKASPRDTLLVKAVLLNVEANRLFHEAKYDLALPLAQRAVEINEEVLQEHPRTATAFQMLASIFGEKGDPEKARPMFQRALEIREKTLPPSHPAIPYTLIPLARSHKASGDYEKAEELDQRALRLFESASGDPPYEGIANSLHDLAIIYQERGEYAKAEPLLQRVVTIWEKAFGPEHQRVGGALSDLATFYRVTGDYLKAEPLFDRALAIIEKASGVDHFDVAYPLQHFANFHIAKGDYDRAAAMLERALAILEKWEGSEHRSLAPVLDSLAAVNNTKGDFAKAERLYLRASAIKEKVFGDEHNEVARSLYNLAALLYERGDHEKAESYLYRALAITRKALGTENPTAASIQELLANLYRAGGDYLKAESLYQDALAIRQKLFGSNHPSIAETLDSLATLSAAKGDTGEALRYQARVNEIGEQNIRLNLAAGSERQKLSYLQTLTDTVHKTISFQARFDSNDSNARAQVAVLVLQRKGRVQDVMTDSLAGLRRRLSAEDLGLLDRLNAITAQLSRLVLQASPKASHEQLNRIRVLDEQKEKLEAEISSRSTDYFRQSQPVTLAAVREAIPNDAALIELAVYRPFDPKAKDSQSAFGEPRYAVYVILSKGEVQWKDLGDAAVIDRAIDQFRDALRDPKRQDIKQLARSVDEKTMQPVRPLLGDATHLLLSPDGSLNLIPFEALVDEQSRYLIERFSFTYLTSGRDLLRLQAPRGSKDGPVVFANPVFGEPGPAARPPTAKRRAVTIGPDLTSVYFAPLGGTAQEAQAIKSLFADARILTGTRATESSLKQAAAPQILHIATHGFFLLDKRIENPLLRSGLALAGANLNKPGDDDGVLTALEASGLNLWGTRLVTLSACDTGIGEVKNGEGVYGLRRAFVLAGAETVVMSLWPVSDYVTRQLMTEYYKELRQGAGRGAALRQVKRRTLERKGREHPFYWASFIQSGEWANLAGKR